jgi:hypothetical protein
VKLRWTFLIAIGLALLAGAAGFGAAVLLPDDPLLTFAAIMCVTALITVPVIAGLTIANLGFDPDSADGRVGMRRLLLVVAGLELLPAVGCLAVALTAPEATLYVGAAVVVSAALLVGGVRLGGRIQRLSVRESQDPPVGTSWSRTVVQRKVRKVLVVFVLGTAVGIAGMVALGGESDERLDPVSAVTYGLPVGLIAAAIACMVVSWPLTKELRNAMGSGYAEQRAIVRVVLRGKADELSEPGARHAANYARIAAASLPFQAAQFALLFGGLWLTQMGIVVRGHGGELSPIPLALVIAYPVFAVVFLPTLLRQTRRARRYAAAHAHLLGPTDDALPSADAAVPRDRSGNDSP